MSDALTFISGKKMPNPFMLAPLTNMQSNDDGTLAEAEYKWLTMRALGGFGLTMTCATFAEQSGKGFDGQLAAVDDSHMAGLTRLAEGIKQYDSLAYTQIVHGGMRTFEKFTGQQPVGPSANNNFGPFAKARQNATRCCSPPDNSAGRCLARFSNPTASNKCKARVLAADFRCPSAICGNIIFSAAENSGSKW